MLIKWVFSVMALFALAAIIKKGGKGRTAAQTGRRRAHRQEPDSSYNMAPLRVDKDEKIRIGKQVFRQELRRCVPALLGWLGIGLLPIALAMKTPGFRFGGIAMLLLLWGMTLKRYLLHPLALLNGNFELYSGRCQELYKWEPENHSDEYRVFINDVWLYVDRLRFYTLHEEAYYYIISLAKGADYLFLSAEDPSAGTGKGSLYR